MTYDSTRTPIRELILQDLETTLATIGPPSYASPQVYVRRWNGNQSTDIAAFPSIAIVPQTEQHDDGRSNLIQHTLPVILVLATRGADWPELFNRLAAEIQVALTLDPSRGGYAVTTQITDDLIYDGDGQQEAGGAQMLITIQYRTRYDDPTTAQ